MQGMIILGWFYLIIIIVIAVVIWFFVSINNAKSNKKRISEMYPGYVCFDIKKSYILINEKGDLIYTLSEDMDSQEKHKKFNIQDIISYEIYENGKSVNSGTRSAIGAILFGIPGAIIGASSGKGKVFNMGINLYLNDFNVPLLKLEFLDVECKTGDNLYIAVKNQLEKFTSYLKYAENNIVKMSEVENKSD